MSPNGILRMSETRFICARQSRHATHRGRSASATPQSHLQKRGYGRPATFSTTDTTQFKRAIDMTDDELAAIVAKARLTVVK